VTVLTKTHMYHLKASPIFTEETEEKVSSRPFLSRVFARNTLAQLLIIHFWLLAYAPDSICSVLYRPDPISALFLAYSNVLKATQGLHAVHSELGKLLPLHQPGPTFGVTKAPS